MKRKTFGLSFLLCVLLVLIFVNSVYSQFPTILYLGYDNGTYTTISINTFDSLNRVDNVWYLNGEPLSTIGTSANAVLSTFSLLYGTVVLLSAIGVICIAAAILMVLKDTSNGVSVGVDAVAVLIVIGVGCLIAVVVMAAMQAVFV